VFAPPAEVAAPIPQAREFGLYSIAQVVDSNDAHAQGGIQYDPLGCAAVEAVSAACGTPGGPPMPGTVQLDVDRWVRSSPFAVYTGPAGKAIAYRPDQLVDKARSWFALGEEAAVERGFWTGDPLTDDPDALKLNAGTYDANTNPHGVEVLAADPVPGKLAVGLLEEALGNRLLGRGVIHCPAVAFPFLPGTEAVGTRMQTEAHTDVVVGRGYTGSGPDGSTRAADSAWVYGTGSVKVTRGETFDVGGGDAARLLNRTTNDLTVLTGRLVTVTYECALVGVRVALS
jgi:hypothetical protein